MALGECRECKKEVSDQADKCPHCGIVRPVMKVYPKWIYTFCKVIWTFVLILFVIVALAVIFADDPKDKEAKTEQSTVETEEQKKARLAECKKDLQCWVNEYEFDASYTCRQIINERAKYGAEWLNESIFDHVPFTKSMRWEDKEEGKFTLYGDALRLTNGFGAKAKTSYSCTYSPVTKIAEIKLLD